MIKVQIRNIKKNRIMVCFSLLLSVILSVSAPFSITSNASSIGLSIESTSFLSSLWSLLLSGQTVSDSLQNPFLDQGFIDMDSVEEVFDWFDELNTYQPGLGDEIKSAVISGALNGSIVLDAQTRADYLEYVKAHNGFATGDIAKTYPTAPAGYVSTLTVNYHLSGSSTPYTDTLTWHSSAGSFLMQVVPTNSSLMYYQFCVGHQANGTFSYSVSPTFDSTRSPISCYTQDNGLMIVLKNNGGGYYFTVDSYSFNTYYLSSAIYTYEQWLNIATNYRLNGTASYNESLTTSQVGSNVEVVSSTSTVEEDGNLTGNFTISVADYETLINVLNGLKSGIITLSDALRAINLASVSDTATVEEKQTAISNIADSVPASSTQSVAVPQAATSAITESRSKVGTLAHIEHAIANAIAQATGQALPYPDEDPDYVPPGDPHIEDWDFPSLDPDNPNPGGSGGENEQDRNRAGDVAAAIPVVASLASDIFDSASGFNLITTIGYSFVIFSAIIGASHFFGALGGRHDDVKSHPLDWDRSAERWSSKRTDFKSDW